MMGEHKKISLGGHAGYIAAFAILAVFFFTLGEGTSVDPLGAFLLLLMGAALGLGLNAFFKRGAREAEREIAEHYLDALEDDDEESEKKD